MPTATESASSTQPLNFHAAFNRCGWPFRPTAAAQRVGKRSSPTTRCVPSLTSSISASVGYSTKQLVVPLYSFPTEKKQLVQWVLQISFLIDGQWIIIMNFGFIHQGGSHTQRKFSAHHARRILYRLFDVRHYCDRIRLSPGRFIERPIITRSIQFLYWRKPWKLDQWKDTGIWRIISVSENLIKSPDWICFKGKNWNEQDHLKE